MRNALPTRQSLTKKAHVLRLTQTASDARGWPHPIHAAEPLTDRKSTFAAHATALHAPAALPALLAHLRERAPRLRRASHCMWAYRCSRAATAGAGVGAPQCGADDGGEGGAGERLARLLELGGAQGVVVVVWRWYGGVKLGADRWRRIAEVAKDALNKGEFLRKGEGGAGTKRGAAKGKANAKAK